MSDSDETSRRIDPAVGVIYEQSSGATTAEQGSRASHEESSVSLSAQEASLSRSTALLDNVASIWSSSKGTLHIIDESVEQPSDAVRGQPRTTPTWPSSTVVRSDVVCKVPPTLHTSVTIESRTTAAAAMSPTLALRQHSQPHTETVVRRHPIGAYAVGSDSAPRESMYAWGTDDSTQGDTGDNSMRAVMTRPSSTSRLAGHQSYHTPSTLTDEPIVATAVIGPPPTTIYEHDGLPEPKPLRVVLMGDGRLRMMIGLLLLLIVGLAVTVVALLTGKKDGNEADMPISSPAPQSLTTNAPFSTPTSTPTMQRNSLIQLLEAASPWDGGVALRNPSTPQYAAANWLLTEDPYFATTAERRQLRNSGLSTTRLYQRYALNVLYYIQRFVGSEETITWSNRTDEHECDWGEWVVCSPAMPDRKITFVRIEWRRLRGTIPQEFNLLTDLTVLRFDGNHLEGRIPQSFPAFLTNLEVFSVANNELTGPFPNSVTEMTSLQMLHLRGNKFAAERFPTEMIALTELKELGLQSMAIGGSIPEFLFTSLPRLSRLYLDDNSFSGRIPTEVGLWTVGEQISLAQNDLTGPIPIEFTQVPNLEAINVGGNQLTGVIPTWFGQFVGTMKVVSLADNLFFGSIPLELTLLTNLNNAIDLSGNSLTGTILTEFGRLRDITWGLDLSRNNFTDTIPTELGYLTKLRQLGMADNPNIRGTIPSELGNLGAMQEAFLQDLPLLEGTIPTELGRWTSVKRFLAYNNNLRGSVPSEICNESLERLEVDCDLTCTCCTDFCF